MSELRVKDSDEIIKVQNVYCVGKNYLDHIKEFVSSDENEEIPDEPVIFLKPNTAVIPESGIVRTPEFKGKKISNNLQNEVELVVVIGKDGINIEQENAREYIYGYAVGIDFTLRDIQTELKTKGLPWTLSKGFLTSAPVSEILKKNELNNPLNLDMVLKVNKVVSQKANTSQMIFTVDYIVHYISSIFGLRRGDLIFTGTPAGITKLNSGDEVEAEIEKIGCLNIKVE
ncbi:MAG: fumarylacetoacetate hydrolase family protein [Ignavibacteria bacterium]